MVVVVNVECGCVIALITGIELCRDRIVSSGSFNLEHFDGLLLGGGGYLQQQQPRRLTPHFQDETLRCPPEACWA